MTNLKLLFVGLLIACIASFILYCGWRFNLRNKTSVRAAKAVEIVQKLAHTKESLEVEPLIGGISDASLLKVATPQQIYVVRFLDKRFSQLHQQEITCQQIASDHAYGPHVFFTDAQQGIIVMEYLAAQPFPATKNQLSAYVELIKKIHTGPSFPATFNLFGFTEDCIKTIAKVQQKIVDIAMIKTLFNTIRQAIACFPHLAPCHRDLNPGNVIYARGQYFAIDYFSAGQDDPYIDLAAPLFHTFLADQQEKLLAEYLGRQPTSQELAKLSLMKSFVLISYGIMLVRYLPEDFIQKVSVQEIKQKKYQQILQQIASGPVDLNKPLHKLEFALSMFQEVLNHSRSEHFSKEVALLTEGCSSKTQ